MAAHELRSVRAKNPGPLTLDGTLTWIVGHNRVAVIDPGPDMDDHVRAVARLVDNADEVAIVVSHGHADHAGGVDSLRSLLPEAQLMGAGHPDCEPLRDGDRVTTDVGDLVAIHTPGHTRDHLCFHWMEARILFAADMVLGTGDTTWVAEYPGCLADYLESLDRLSTLQLDRVLSAHGPPIEDPSELWPRYRRHRERRIAAARQAMKGLGLRPGDPRDVRTEEEILTRIYGRHLPAGLVGAAASSLSAILEYVDTHPEGS